MAEQRGKTETIDIYMQVKGGKKLTKIELFPAHLWSNLWYPGSRSFSPRLPLQSEARKEYWETRYRARINGVWHVGAVQYRMLTRDEIIDKFVRVKSNGPSTNNKKAVARLNI